MSPGPDDPHRTTEGITLHSSWRGIVSGTVGATVVAAAGTYGVIAAGFVVVPTVLFLFGWFLVIVMVWDFPIASTFTTTGVTRRMALRRQPFEWRDTDQLTRTRPRLLRLDRAVEHGGLTLVRGRRRYLLVDRVESADEFDDLVEVLEAATFDVGAERLLRPGAKVAPTWLYRRRHWRPDSAPGR